MPNTTPPLDDRARHVMRIASQRALEMGRSDVDPDHVLLGILDEGTGITASTLDLIGRDFGVIRAEIHRRMQRPSVSVPIARIRASLATTQILEHAAYEALQAGFSVTSTAHLVLGILRVPGIGAFDVLTRLGVTLEAVRGDMHSDLHSAET